MAKLRIVSQSNEPFSDRAEAGRLLARELEQYRGRETLVLGIPGGGVVVAAELAHELDAVLDVILSRKIGSPIQPELAIGAVAEDGSMVLNRGILDRLGIPEEYVAEEKARQMAQIDLRKKNYRRAKPAEACAGRNVILTDDGVATGATMEAALWTLRKENPRRLVAALPVGPQDAIERLSGSADEMICLRVPESFYAVGQFYREFKQVNEKEIIGILKRAADSERERIETG